MRKLATLLGCMLLVACASNPQQETKSAQNIKTDANLENIELKAAASLGVDTAGLDRSVRPQDDFFRYVNGVWLDTIEIPADQSNYGSFTELSDLSQETQKKIITQLGERKNPAGSDAERIGNFYKAFMNENAIEGFGRKPLQPWLHKINGVESKDQLMHYFGEMQKYGLGGPLTLWVNQDANEATRYATYISQAGLSLPDRDYYLKDEERFTSIRSEYLKHIELMFGLSRLADASDSAKQILDLETRIAEIQWDRVRNRDRNATNNPVDRAALIELFGNANIQSFLAAAQLSKEVRFIVRQPDYQQKLVNIIEETPMVVWRNYMRWQLIRNTSPYLSEDFVNANFDFFSRTLRGVEEIRPRWKRGVSAVNRVLGESIGKIYVEQEFAPESKERMDRMVEYLRSAFAQSIDSLEWMSPNTKKEAHQKLSKFTPKIGYPAKWKSYAGLEVSDRNLVTNLMASSELEYQRMLDKLGSPIDRDEWFMTPQTVNAYYNPSMNEIVFPAAILQPPFFNVDADDAVNYGAIGAVIGHEFSHGFDDQGRKSDGDGNLRDWWTEQDAEEFKRRADGLVAQYNQFSPLKDEFVNGKLTLGENIGDLAGLTMAYRAYKLSLNGQESPVIAGFTGDQRFFMGWAQVWQRAYRDDELRRRLLTDPHSPSEYRVNGIVANMPEFHRAFNVKSGDKLYRSEQEIIKIW